MTETSSLKIRPAERADTALILAFIRELAEYERLSGEVKATEEGLREALFHEKPAAQVLLAFLGEEAAGFALFFPNFSTFLGKPGIYLEDLFVRPRFRGRGVGRTLLQRLAELAMERGAGRMEWSVLDWNEGAINFYRRLGAIPLDDWTTFRVTGEALGRLAQRPPA